MDAIACGFSLLYCHAQFLPCMSRLGCHCHAGLAATAFATAHDAQSTDTHSTPRVINNNLLPLFPPQSPAEAGANPDHPPAPDGRVDAWGGSVPQALLRGIDGSHGDRLGFPFVFPAGTQSGKAGSAAGRASRWARGVAGRGVNARNGGKRQGSSAAGGGIGNAPNLLSVNAPPLWVGEGAGGRSAASLLPFSSTGLNAVLPGTASLPPLWVLPPKAPGAGGGEQGGAGRGALPPAGTHLEGWPGAGAWAAAEGAGVVAGHWGDSRLPSQGLQWPDAVVSAPGAVGQGKSGTLLDLWEAAQREEAGAGAGVHRVGVSAGGGGEVERRGEGYEWDAESEGRGESPGRDAWPQGPGEGDGKEHARGHNHAWRQGLVDDDAKRPGVGHGSWRQGVVMVDDDGKGLVRDAVGVQGGVVLPVGSAWVPSRGVLNSWSPLWREPGVTGGVTSGVMTGVATGVTSGVTGMANGVTGGVVTGVANGVTAGVATAAVPPHRPLLAASQSIGASLDALAVQDEPGRRGSMDDGPGGGGGILW